MNTIDESMKLLSNIGLSYKDIYRLKNNEINYYQLITEIIKPIAKKKYDEELDDVQLCNDTPNLKWYVAELSEGLNVYNSGDRDLDCYDLSLKSDLPEWMTWSLLSMWIDWINKKNDTDHIIQIYKS